MTTPEDSLRIAVRLVMIGAIADGLAVDKVRALVHDEASFFAGPYAVGRWPPAVLEQAAVDDA